MNNVRIDSRRLTLAAWIVIGIACVASDWPRFRGPNGAGIARDTDIPLSWTETQGVLWKTPISGVGNSSPIVCKGRVFLQSAGADGNDRSMICINATDSKLVWTQTVPGQRTKAHKLNSFASATPASDGERVFAAFWDGQDVALHAFDFDGKPQWKRQLGPFTSQHGPGTSPIEYGGKVFFANDQDGAAEVYALDAKTGAISWQVRRKPFRASYATPFIHQRDNGVPELVVASTAGMTSYVPETGKENWRWVWEFNGEPLRCVALPTSCGDRILVCSGDGDGRRHAAALKFGGNGAAADLTLAWQTEKRSFPYVPSPIALGDHFYFVSDKGFASCVSADNGETLWSERLGGSDVLSSPVLINGSIYAINDSGTCFVFSASPKFQLLGRSEIGERVCATPAVANGRLYIRGEAHLFCIGKR